MTYNRKDYEMAYYTGLPYSAAEKPEAFHAWMRANAENLRSLFSDFKKESGDKTSHLREFCEYMWIECDQDRWLSSTRNKEPKR